MNLARGWMLLSHSCQVLAFKHTQSGAFVTQKSELNAAASKSAPMIVPGVLKKAGDAGVSRVRRRPGP
jgi:hypothetical protein